MWVISGPFDGAQEGVKEKLLKPGTTYTVGRAKAGQSLLNRINLEQKSISHEHVEIIVGHYEIDDVSDSQAKPTVQLVLKREKDITVSNQRVGKGMVVDLEAGSEVALTNKISIYMLWKPVVVVNADNRVKKERMREIAAAAAKIGVTVSKTWRDNATHFVTPPINMSRRVLHSLMLGISLVDLKWLEELFRRGNALTVESEPDENGVVALESHFVLPNEQDFRPKSVKTDEDDEDITGWPIELWDANPARKTIWDRLQFHFFCDDAAPTEWIDQVQLGGGTFKSPPEPEPLPQARRPCPLKKLRPQSQEPSAIQLPEPAAQTGLSEISEDKQELASEVPRPRLLKRRVKTTTIAEALGLDNSNASITTMIPLEEESKPQPLREEVKRLERVKSPSSATVQESSDIVVSSTSRPNRLKRRADVLAERTTTAPTPIEIDVPEAPALKRYRQLFEGVERAASSVFEVHGGSTISAAVLSQPVQPPEPADDTRKRKSADRDEEDDANMEDVTRAKRRVPASGISQKPDQLSQSAPSWEPNPGLQVTVQSQTLPASQAHTRASGSRGAAPGAPDKDNALLHALAQTENEAISTLKTGKPKGAKTAPIDQEFSNMRIVEEKEEEASRRRAEEMRVWEECERDVNVRGNFMVVELVNLVRRNRGPPVRSINPAWEGKPDFKKFKKKAVGPRVARVAVFASSGENLDYGMGDDYWEQKAALAGVRGSSEGPPTHIRVQDDDSDTPMPKIAKPMRDNKTTQATIYTKASAATEPRTKPKPQRIAISSYESEEDESNKLRGASSNIGIGRRRPVAGSARKTDLTDFRVHDEDEDSEGGGQPRRGGRQEEQSYGSTRVGDEDAVSHMVEEESHQITTAGALSHMSSLGGASLGVRKTVTSGSSVVNPSKPKKVTVVDSDSDGGGFKGFGTKRRKRGVAQ